MEAQVKLMSYNIKYANENDGENSWSLRKDFLTNQIKFYEPDIFGVQEAVLEQLRTLDRVCGAHGPLGGADALRTARSGPGPDLRSAGALRG